MNHQKYNHSHIEQNLLNFKSSILNDIRFAIPKQTVIKKMITLIIYIKIINLSIILLKY